MNFKTTTRTIDQIRADVAARTERIKKTVESVQHAQALWVQSGGMAARFKAEINK